MTDFAQLLTPASADQLDQTQMMYPPRDEADLANRMEGWKVALQKLQEPNIARAIGVFGQYLMQPRPWGQTPLGHLGKALNVGMVAYDMGEQAKLEREKAQTALERVRAETEETKTRTEGMAFDNAQKQRTADAAVRRINALAEQAELELKAAKRKDKVDEILQKYEARKAKIMDSFSDDSIALMISDTLEKQGVENKLKELQGEMYAAHARYYDDMRGKASEPNPQITKLDEQEKLRQGIAPYYQKIVADGIAAIKAQNPKLSDEAAASQFWLLTDPAKLLVRAEMEYRAKGSMQPGTAPAPASAVAPTKPQGTVRKFESREEFDKVVAAEEAKQQAAAPQKSEPKKPDVVVAAEKQNQAAYDSMLEKRYAGLTDRQVKERISLMDPLASKELERRARVKKGE